MSKFVVRIIYKKKITRRLSAASEIIFEGVLGMFALLT